MRIVFMGTPDLAATILEELAAHHEVAAVYTRPDAVRGRGKALVPSPVKATAESLGLPVLTPKTLRDEAVQAELAAFEPEAICVAAYGALLPREVLDLPPHGCVNVHASLLPRWRGAAPIERAILAGDPETGVSIMLMEEGLDTGPFCVQRAIPIAGKAQADLADELAILGVRALLTALELVEAGSVRWMAQPAEGVTYAHKLEKRELCLAPDVTALENARRVQASSPAHPTRCVIGGRTVSVTEAAWAVADCAALPADVSVPASSVPQLELLEEVDCGQATFVDGRLYLTCAHTEGEGAGLDGAPALGAGEAAAWPVAEPNLLEVRALKPDGKKAMDAAAFAAGMPALRDGAVAWEALA
ncbi:MAG: methionyl-tRNA formyltransferase [Eggerthellaceae bacterium]|jgi:methionyl-tRNA formyltransferase|nr:methionyl-tRNA formyltransferase [Eggerthellaceae bacterium]